MEFMASIMDTVFWPLKDYFARTFIADQIEPLGHEMDEVRSNRRAQRGWRPPVKIKWQLKCMAKLEEATVWIDGGYQVCLQLPPDQAAGVRATYLLYQKANEMLSEAAGLKAEWGVISGVRARRMRREDPVKVLREAIGNGCWTHSRFRTSAQIFRFQKSAHAHFSKS